MLLTRASRPILRPFVKTLWAIDQPTSPFPEFADQERVLPTGTMHLAIRLSVGETLFVLQFHEAYHVGQTGLLRRMAGHEGAIA